MWKSPNEIRPVNSSNFYYKNINENNIFYVQNYLDTLFNWSSVQCWCYEEELTQKEDKQERKYLPTLSDLIDRMSILQLKETFIKDHREEYAKELEDICSDINLIIDQNDLKLNARTIRAISLVSQMNLHIWFNERNCRLGIAGENNLSLTHAINSCRNHFKNIIQEITGGRLDYKLDCAKEAEDYIPTEFKKEMNTK